MVAIASVLLYLILVSFAIVGAGLVLSGKPRNIANLGYFKFVCYSAAWWSPAFSLILIWVVALLTFWASGSWPSPSAVASGEPALIDPNPDGFVWRVIHLLAALALLSSLVVNIVMVRALIVQSAQPGTVSRSQRFRTFVQPAIYTLLVALSACTVPGSRAIGWIID